MSDVKRYTADEMIEALRRDGLEVSHRRIRDWVTFGLLDEPRVVGLGRGKGKMRATWAAPQLALLRAIAVNRRLGRSIKTVCNLPVWGWLNHGDEVVPLQQATKALKTWAGTPVRGWDAALKAARQLVTQVAPPKFPRQVRKRVVDAVATAVYSRDYESAEFRDGVRDLFDPSGKSPVRGKGGAAISADQFLFLMKSRVAALSGLDLISNAEFYAAREDYRASRNIYREVRPLLAADNETGHLFADQPNSPETACLHLLTILGLRKTGNRL